MAKEDVGEHVLPDPYGHGFVRAENPVERTMEKWLQQERFVCFGLLARHPGMLTHVVRRKRRRGGFCGVDAHLPQPIRYVILI